MLKQAAPLPLDAAGVRDMLLSQAGLPPELARHLDTGAPLAGASVVGGKAGAPFTAFSFAARTPADVMALLAALGHTISRRGNALEVENAAGDRGWFLPMGKLVVFADTEEALVRAGSLALEARRSISDDISVTLYPDMIARAAGTGMQAALARFNLELEERAAASGNKLGPEATRQVAALVSYIGDVAVAELLLDVDAARGVSVLARLQPKPGSRLQALAHDQRPSVVDGALVRAATGTGSDAGVVVSSVYGEMTLDQLARVRSKLPSGARGSSAEKRATAKATALLAALAEGLVGQFSLAGRVQPGLSWEMVYPVRDAAGAARIEAALLAADKDAIAAVARAATLGEGADVKVLKARRESLGKRHDLHVTLAPVVPATADPALRRMLGAGGLDLFLAVMGGDRLVVTAGQGAKTRLAAIAGGGRETTNTIKTIETTKTRPPGEAGAPVMSTVLADAVALAGPRSLFYFLDLRQVIALVGAAGGSARFHMLTGAMRTAMPILGGAAGDGQGQTFTLDLTIPTSCFTGMGAVIQAVMMAPR